MSKITSASIQFDPNGTPYSSQFDDIYFSKDNGLEESRYVFLENNSLPDRWLKFQSERFVVAETGFGTGLNFLLCSQQFISMLDKHADLSLQKLHFISFEKYPLSKQDLQQSLSYFPQLSRFADELIKHYPIASPGAHRISLFGGRITLDLWFGDVNDLLPQMANHANGLIDCWFLDGFAPSKNSAMWTQTVFEQMARLAKPDCSISTFTAAGFVRRGLEQAGFSMRKSKGFGHKREMLCGQLQQVKQDQSVPGYYRLPAPVSRPVKLAIIGGGLAAANLCYSLAQAGIETTLYCKDSDLACGASGNAQGGFYPLLQQRYSPLAEFHSTAFTFARHRYQTLLDQGFVFEHEFCGVSQAAFTEKLVDRYTELAQSNLWPNELAHWLEHDQFTEKTGLDTGAGGLFYPEGGWINPPSLVMALINAARVHAPVNIVTDCHVSQLRQQSDAWILTATNTRDHAQVQHVYDHVVLCTGAELNEKLSPTLSHISIVRGQVSRIHTTANLAKLKTVLCFKGYLTPQWQHQHCLGASFIKDDSNTDNRDSEDQSNIDLLGKCFPQQQWYKDIELSDARASLRATTLDHLPLVGAIYNDEQQRHDYADLAYSSRGNFPVQQVENGLSIMNGLGSRGLSIAPLCAEVLTSYLIQQPYPVNQRTLSSLLPNRFLIRAIKRQSMGKKLK